jgi:Cu-Zn family superoxide dismutase
MSMPKHKFTAKHKSLLVAAAGVLGVATGAGVMATAGATESQSMTPPAPEMVVWTLFAPASMAPYAQAVTYNTDLVPVASQVQVREELSSGGGTGVELRLTGLVSNRVYGAHVHTQPCGELPDDAGPHYQNQLDPTQPSVDPEFANPENEVWLDVTTNEDGSGRSVATVDWRFRDGGARSVVVHEMATATHEGHAGTAGDRLGCVNVPFM